MNAIDHETIHWADAPRKIMDAVSATLREFPPEAATDDQHPQHKAAMDKSQVAVENVADKMTVRAAFASYRLFQAILENTPGDTFEIFEVLKALERRVAFGEVETTEDAKARTMYFEEAMKAEYLPDDIRDQMFGRIRSDLRAVEEAAKQASD